MTSSKPLRCAVLILLVLAGPPALLGCGSSGRHGGPSDAVLAYFLFGDPSVAFGGHELLFGVGGAPTDGFLERLDAQAAAARALTHGLDLAILFWVAIALEAGASSGPLTLTYDLPGAVSDGSPSPDELALEIDLWGLADEDDDDEFDSGSDMEFEFGRDTHRVRALLEAPTRFGLADMDVDIDLEGDVDEVSVRRYVLAVEQGATSLLDATGVQLLLGGTVLEDLGSLQPGVPQTLSTSFTVPAAQGDLPLALRFTTAPGSFWRDFRVELRQDLHVVPPPLDTRVFDLPFAPEGIDPIQRDLYARLRPAQAPFGVDRYAFTAVGSGLLEGFAPPLPDPLVTTDTDDPLVGELTYRARLLLPGDPDPATDPYWKPGDPPPTTVDPVIAARVLVGAYGISIANFDDTTGAFEAHTVQESGNMTDVCPFDGDEATGRAVYVDNAADAIKFIELDTGGDYVLAPGSTLTNAGWSGASGKVVSACRHPSGDLLFVTDGDPGELWRFAPGDTVATKLFDTYGAPRTVRTAGNIAAVGCYGSALGFGGLRLLVRSGAGTWSNAPFSRLGARSVGIDMRELPDGRVAIASTSFLTHEVIVTIVSGTTGEILDDQVLSLPAGHTGPGHCAFLRDPGVDGLFVTCNTSSTLVLMPVDLGP